jgi:DNA-binding transcriptional MerR regulator
MQIGIVAKKVGLSVYAIRFYERNALLPRPARTQGGFRQYGERHAFRMPLSKPSKQILGVVQANRFGSFHKSSRS